MAKLDATSWPDWTNFGLTCLMGIKAFVDIPISMSSRSKAWQKYEPWIDGGASVVWMAPTIAAAFYADPSDPVTWLNMVAGLFFCGNGMLAPAVAEAEGDLVAEAAVDALAAVFNHLWGLLSVASAITGYVE
jgi:hypothetical protein